MSEINMNEIVKFPLNIQSCLYKHYRDISRSLKLHYHVLFFFFNFKHGCVHLSVWVILSVILQLCLEQAKKAQNLDLQRMDLVLLSTSAVKGRRQWPVFNRLISSSSQSYRASLPDPFRLGMSLCKWLNLVSWNVGKKRYEQFLVWPCPAFFKWLFRLLFFSISVFLRQRPISYLWEDGGTMRTSIPLLGLPFPTLLIAERYFIR